MAISKTHALLALSGLTAVVAPTATVLILKSKNVDSKTEIDVSLPKVCSIPTPEKKYLTKIYKDVVGESKTTSTVTQEGSGTGSVTEATPDKIKLEKWERFMKSYGYDCQGNKLNTAS